MKKPPLVCAAALLLSAAAHAAGPYHVIKSIPIPGAGVWDYIGMDSVNRHVLVSHGVAVEILNADTFKVDGEIAAPGVDPAKPETLTGMAVRGGTSAPEINRGFVVNSRDSSISIFDLKTLKVLAVVKVGDGPDGYLYDPATKRGFTFSDHTKAATAVDLGLATLAGTVPLGSKPEAAAADGRGHVFVNLQEVDKVAKINSRKLAVEATWSTAPCNQPTSMAMDAKTNRLFIGCRGDHPMLVVMDAANGKIVTTLPIGAATDAAAFDAEKQLVFTSNGEGTITVVREDSADTFTVADTVKTEPGARTMTLDTKTHHLFLITADRATQPPAPGQRPGMDPNSFRVLVVGPE